MTGHSQLLHREVNGMPRIGPFFELHFGWPSGCNECKGELYDCDIVAWVNDKLTCKDCVDRLNAGTAIGQKAARRTGGDGERGQ